MAIRPSIFLFSEYLYFLRGISLLQTRQYEGEMSLTRAVASQRAIGFDVLSDNILRPVAYQTAAIATHPGLLPFLLI